jgi:hypothetical protein
MIRLRWPAWAWPAWAMLAVSLTACGTATSVADIADDPTSPAASPSEQVPDSPTVPGRAGIPEDFPLDLGLPTHGSEFTLTEVGSEADAPAVDWCGPVPSLAGERVDLAGVIATGPEYADWRVLHLYESDPAATAATSLLRDAAATCEQREDETFGRRPSTLAGDETFTVVQTYSDGTWPTLGATFWQVVRIGSSLLVAGTYGEWDPQSNLDEGIALHAKDLAPIVEAMRVFAG